MHQLVVILAPLQRLNETNLALEVLTHLNVVENTIQLIFPKEQYVFGLSRIIYP
jgi:hypothetical protein